MKDVWTAGQPRTYLGMLADGFPNMLMVLGPHTARGNIPQAIEHCVNFQAGLLRFMKENNYRRVETRPEHVAEWTDTVIKASEGLLASKIDSWQTGVNRNVDGRAGTPRARLQRQWCALPQEDRRNGPRELSGTQFPLVRRG